MLNSLKKLMEESFLSAKVHLFPLHPLHVVAAVSAQLAVLVPVMVWGKKVQTCATTSLSRLLTCIAWKEYEAQKEELLREWREGVQQTVDTMKACNVISLDEQHLEVPPLPPSRLDRDACVARVTSASVVS